MDPVHAMPYRFRSSCNLACARLASLAILLTAVLALPTLAHAQSAEQQQTATARLLFKTGVEQGDAGDWVSAADSFRRALALRESVVIRFNLAHALQQTGKLLEASEHFRAVQADPEADPELVQGAGAALAQIEPRLAVLTVEVRGAPEGSQVILDGATLLPAQLGVPVPADPGAHEATLEVEGEVAARESVSLEEGGSGTVELVYVATPAQAAATLAVEPPAEPPPGDDRSHRKRRRWIAGVSAAVVVVATAVIVGVAAGGGGGGSGVSGFDPPTLTVMGE